jgi:dinuclear metal center YbgI/SA1388 family protein
MIHLHQVIQTLERIAPPNFQEDYDNAGLITGHPSMRVSGIIVSLDATEEVVDDAIARSCNVIVAHHPIIFRGLKKINGNNYIERTIIKAIKNDIAIYAIHTNLDNVYHDGVSTKIASVLGLTDVQILSPKPNVWHPDGNVVGSGAIGYLTKALPTQTFFSYLCDKMKIQTFRHTTICKESIGTVALCGGSGSFLLNSAISAKADIFISADFKYHEFFDANEEIIIVDIGHYESEKFTIDLLVEALSVSFENIEIHVTVANTNPVYYFK